MSFQAVAVSNHLVALAHQHGEAVTPLKLQKLVYFAHGWYLALKEQPLLKERVQAWKYGPVVPELYHALKVSGGGAVSGPATMLTIERESNGELCVRRTTPDIADGAAENDVEFTKALLHKIWDVYGNYSATVLSNATHAPGTAWSVTWDAAKGARNVVIPDDLIKADFVKLIKPSPVPRADSDSPTHG